MEGAFINAIQAKQQIKGKYVSLSSDFKDFIAKTSSRIFNGQINYKDEFPRRRNPSPIRLLARTSSMFGGKIRRSPRRPVSPSKGRINKIGIIRKCLLSYCTCLSSLIVILCVVCNLCSVYCAMEESLVLMVMSVVLLYHLEMVRLSLAVMAVMLLFSVLLMVDASSGRDMVVISFIHVLGVTLLLVIQPQEEEDYEDEDEDEHED